MLKVNNYSNYILKDINLELQEFQNLIILGSNGAGKTTLAKAICGLIPNDRVTIDMKNPSQIYGQEKTSLINYIPPKLEVFDEHISVYEFLELNRLYKQDKIEDTLNLLDIQKLKDKSCKNLSSGEAQLLLLAGALLHNATFTVFDEITSNLDPKRLRSVFDILKDKNTLRAKIIITHNLHLAYKLGFDILFMEDGKCSYFGANEEFFSDENLKNYFNGSVKKVDDSIVVDI